MTKYKKIPGPFTFFIEEKNKLNYINMVLFGSGKEFLPYIYNVFFKMGQKGIGKFRIKFKIVDILENNKSIFNSKNNELNLNTSSTYFTNNKKSYSNITINFITPLRIISNNKFLNTFTAKKFISTLLRRIYLLSIFYCNFDPEFNFTDILKLAESINIKQKTYFQKENRFSYSQKKKINIGGLLGKIIFEGENLSKIYNIFNLGELIHIGKSTSIGNGKYTIIK